jgi:predicted CoA-binding protein
MVKNNLPKRTQGEVSLKELRESYTTGTKSDVEIVQGKKDTGKTSYLINEVINNSKKDVILVHPSAKFKKTTFKAKHGVINIYQMSNDVLKGIDLIKFLRNKTVLLDEAKQIISHNPNEDFTKKLLRLMAVSRHYNISLYLVYHFMRDINPKIYGHADRITLFKSSEKLDKYLDVLGTSSEEIKAARKEVNAKPTMWARKTIQL